MERRNTSVRQMEMLVEFAETHTDLALGRLRSKEARALAARLWQECANILNSEGPARTSREWAKVWNDTKCRVRARLTAAAVARRGTGGGPCQNATLSSLEERVADIIGRDIGPIPNVSQNQFVATEENEERVEVVQILEVMDVSTENNGDGQNPINLEGPGPSSHPSHSISQRTLASLRTSPNPPESSQSVTSTPRRGRQRPRARQRNTGASRVRPQVQTSRSVLDESRAMVLRIEELRARTDYTLSQAALTQAEAAKAQAEAAKAQADASLLQSQTVASFCQALSGLLPAVQVYLQSQTRRRIISSRSASEDEN